MVVGFVHPQNLLAGWSGGRTAACRKGLLDKKLKKKTSNRLLKLFYDSQINKFQAKLKVYEKEMGEEQSSETFFTAGKVIVVGGALLGLGIMVQVIRVLGSAKRAVDRK